MKYGNKKLRHELKYYISYNIFEELRSRLRYVVKPDKNSVNEDGYHIRSLYFDDVYDNAIYEKLWGIHRRDKYRIRIYNESDRHIKLERKSKYGDYICKESMNLTREEYEKIMMSDFEFLKQKNSQLGMDFYVKCTSEHMQPRIIVDYIREAYTYEHGDVRITFDKRLMAGVNSFYIFNPKLVTVNAIHNKAMVLEIKYNEYLPSHIHTLLQLESHQRSAISKYVICREEGMYYYKI
ncbi:polyphosphate polymerase domain-containing protein [Neobacillus dielmonensis]|uniref:polyphosphate polymerase domain-containing protein n=1 Tax=Neobacillus dielmonensis TaxID=1347369 RepID=UPI0005AA2C9A|nr:polyphosphate polymerase domain-containing protein [Neobacillus dielmonensis]